VSLRDWFSPEYLLHGSASQQQAYALFQSLGLPRRLPTYRWVLVGTFPLGLEVPGSDLDILGQHGDVRAAAAELRALFSHERAYREKIRSIRGRDSLILQFTRAGLPVELFVQDQPTEQQHGFLHMVKEHALLERLGPRFAEAVRSLKQQGVKTEPAFAQALGIVGDPWIELLEYELDESQVFFWQR
jgi:hypothetical protein